MSNSTSHSWLTPARAARRAEASAKAIRDWCSRYGIGRKVAGRWRVDPAALDRLLNGTADRGGEHAHRTA